MAEKLNESQQTEIKKLTLALDHLGLTSGVKTNPIEAERIAWSAILYPLHLTNQYRLTSPPLLHNSLVNSGLREKGLCVDWTADMMRHMMKLKLNTYDLHWGVANLGNPFTEHNSLIVTAKGQAFDTGLLLDPWRYSGQLYWQQVKDDTKYEWMKYR